MDPEERAGVDPDRLLQIDDVPAACEARQLVEGVLRRRWLQVARTLEAGNRRGVAARPRPIEQVRRLSAMGTTQDAPPL